MTEAELAQKFVEYLQDQYELYFEVEGVDIVAKNGHILIAVEVKTSLNFRVIEQAYKSKVFNYATEDKTIINADQIIEGGAGYNYVKLHKEIEHSLPDYGLYNYPHALGFLTRGCIRKCYFCIVPQKEGILKANTDIDEFLDKRKTAVLMDNNVLASNHGLEQIEKIIKLGIKVDFNQGLDARIISANSDIAKLLSRVKWLKPLRMACDNKNQMQVVQSAVEKLRKYGATPRQYFVYMLVTDIDDALERFYFLRNLKVDPFAQPLISNVITPTKEQKRFARFVNTRQLRNVSWDDYKYK